MNLAKVGMKMMCGTAGRIVFAGALLAAASMAQVAPTSIFQLNGNAANDNLTCSYGTPCDYWNLLNGLGCTSGGVCNTPGSAGHSVAGTFINGTSTTDSFATGGSKDPNPISMWKYTAGPTPNKDTLNAAYGAVYNQGGHVEFIFGADRLSASGDANIGIWFFQEKVLPNGSGGFTGAHQDGDLFLISAFTGGGGTSTISVYKWDHSCSTGVKNPAPGQCADTNLKLLANPSTVCGSTAYCAVTNSTATSSTWGGGSIASPLFFEGGIDVTTAFSGSAPSCFTSFLIETRSSQSTTAVLKDFLSGGFPECSLGITKTCPAPGVVGASNITYTYTGTVSNTGLGTLYDVSVVDNGLPSDAGNVQFCTGSGCTPSSNATCGGTPQVCTFLVSNPLSAGTSVNWTMSLTSTSGSAQNSAYAISDENSGTAPTACPPTDPTAVCSASSGNATCSTEVDNRITITKNCGVPCGSAASAYPDPNKPGNTVDCGTYPSGLPGTQLVTSGGLAVVQANFSGQICNSGSTALSNIVVTDVPQGGTGTTAGITVLWPGTAGTIGPAVSGTPTCVNYSGSYKPSGASGLGLAAGRYGFTDEIYVSGATPAFGNPVATSTTCAAMTGAPSNPQNCDGKTCNICFGDTSSTGLGLCNTSH